MKLLKERKCCPVPFVFPLLPVEIGPYLVTPLIVYGSASCFLESELEFPFRPPMEECSTDRDTSAIKRTTLRVIISSTSIPGSITANSYFVALEKGKGNEIKTTIPQKTPIISQNYDGKINRSSWDTANSVFKLLVNCCFINDSNEYSIGYLFATINTQKLYIYLIGS
ncbi:hypothetical protein DdX_01069 [Ditylenchus destructor]|uniref:Uncharacterized protein n=1 Tax=Ditylenchus destructor TaxID=166010 RepID=A0AAD4NHJ8_9BILA|nr:hypothetical protein DdX_01069 [Ditylenchus destructor]